MAPDYNLSKMVMPGAVAETLHTDAAYRPVVVRGALAPLSLASLLILLLPHRALSLTLLVFRPRLPPPRVRQRWHPRRAVGPAARPIRFHHPRARIHPGVAHR